MKKIISIIFLLLLIGLSGCTELKMAKVFLPHSYEELYHRIGGFYHWYKEIPLWFDESLASLTMKKYSRYDEDAWNRILGEQIPYPTKDELVSLKQWNDTNHKYLVNDTIAVPYAVARKIVSKWYIKVRKEGLLKLLDGIKKGEKFKELYVE